ncbi:MAG: ComEC/Rec2 family competence protein [Candidatus Omnitrophota bacterium]
MILFSLSLKNLNNKSSTYFLLISFFILGAVFLRNYEKLPAHHLTKLNIKTTAIRSEGKVISDPKVNQTSSFIFDTKYLIFNQTKLKVSGKVLVKCFNKEDFLYQENLILEGKLSPVFNYGKFDYRKYLYQQNIYYTFNVKQSSQIQHLSYGNKIIKSIFKLRENLDTLITQNISYPNNLLLSAIILGKRQNLPRDLQDIFVQTGTVHILAISGLNVGIILFIFLAVLKILRIKRKARYLIAMLLFIFYCILTGSSPSVVRATIMGCVFLAGLLLERELNIYNSLGLSALIILFINPSQLFDVGFELSFICVLAIVYLSPKIIDFFAKIKLEKPKFLIQSISVSFAAWISILPITIYNFHMISPVTILANLIIVPLSSLITAAGFAFLIISSILPFSTSIFARSCEFLIQIMVISTYWFSKLPGAYFRI